VEKHTIREQMRKLKVITSCGQHVKIPYFTVTYVCVLR